MWKSCNSTQGKSACYTSTKYNGFCIILTIAIIALIIILAIIPYQVVYDMVPLYLYDIVHWQYGIMTA